MPIARVGTRVRFSGSFERLGTTTPETPPEVTVKYRAPTGPEEEWTLTGDPLVVIEDSAGNLHADIRVMEPRRHYFLMIGSGDPELEQSIEEHIDVPESAFEDPLP